MTLQDKVRDHVRSAWGETINRERSFHSWAEIDDWTVDTYIDEQTNSWLLEQISDTLEADNDQGT